MGSLIPVERIENRIFVLRGHKIMLDADLAKLYEVETRVLIQAVSRNLSRFPADFMFRLSKEEFQSLRSQIVISKQGAGPALPALCLYRAGRRNALKRFKQ